MTHPKAPEERKAEMMVRRANLEAAGSDDPEKYMEPVKGESSRSIHEIIAGYRETGK